MTVTARLKESFENAKTQFEGFEKQLEKKVGKLEKKAKAQIEEVKDQLGDVPAQLRGTWENVIQRFRSALAFATREELIELAAKVEELTKKVDKLIRGEKVRAAAQKVAKKPGA